MTEVPAEHVPAAPVPAEHLPAAPGAADHVPAAPVPAERVPADPAPDSIALPFEPGAAALAREFITMAATGIPGSTIADLLLLTSELVSNAVRHGSPTIVLTAVRRPGLLRVEVLNGGTPSDGVAMRPATTTAEGGRGLILVDSIADRWGVEVLDEKTRAWFEIGL